MFLGTSLIQSTTTKAYILGVLHPSRRYTVVERTDETEYWVKITLKHNGHKLYTKCNNYKATATDPNKTESCNLHVGQTVDCQFFADRLSLDAGGYNLICGEQRTNGKLTTDGKNELLIVEREEW